MNGEAGPLGGLTPLVQRYIRDWPAVQAELAFGSQGDFFRCWVPDLLNRETPPRMEEVWALMDGVWDADPPRDEEGFKRYYAHPVWVLNAKFEEIHEASIAHRLLAIELAKQYFPKRALDKGGGYGLLLRMAADALPDTYLDLQDITDVESPRDGFPQSEKVRVVARPEGPYDVIWSIEVFEHLTDPLKEAFEINRLLRVGGKLITSYSFYPMIKCHLPQNFHLRHIFHRVLPFLGYRLRSYERPGITIWVFEKVWHCSAIRLSAVRLALTVLRPLLEFLNVARSTLRRT